MLTFIHERRSLAMTMLAEADAGLGALPSIFVRSTSKRLATIYSTHLFIIFEAKKNRSSYRVHRIFSSGSH